MEAALGTLPTRQEFLYALDKAMAPKPAPADVALFGPFYAKPAEHRPGTDRTHQQAYKAAKEFEAMCVVRQVQFDDLDDWFVAFAKWTVHPQFLLDDSSQLEAALLQRKQFAEEANE